MVVLLLYFLGLTQGRGLIESGQGPEVMLAVHVVFAVLSLVLLHWERISKRWSIVNV
jgi:hypothetical protein